MSVIDRLTANPLVEKLKAKYGYPLGTRLMRLGGIIDEMLFLNYGYEEEPPMAIPLEASDEPNRFCIQQYHRTAAQVDLSGKKVLEVSCGHGGGASYLFRTLHPASYTGLDRNGAAIAFCRRRHNLPGLAFVHGDAQNLPFPDQSFDAVINVEASHCYPEFSRFLAEVARVLRPGGHFLYTDLHHRTAVAEWEAALADCPMRTLSCDIINDQLLRAIDQNSQRLLELIDRRVPKVVRGVARAQTGLEGELFNRDMRSGDLSYRVYCMTKD